MMWSLSTAKMFDRCQRQWFFKTQLANARARDERRRLAYRLGKLQSVSAWRGSLVDRVLSEVVVPALVQGRGIMADTAVTVAMERFERGLAIAKQHRLHDPACSVANDDDFVAFHALEYGTGVGENEIEQARTEIAQAIRGFFGMHDLLARLRSADRVLTQRSLVFAHSDDVSVRAVPDAIVFKGSEPPTIIDWKVHVFGHRDAWLQLAIYAAALTRCTPHKDFPVSPDRFRETEIELLEVQLLTGTIRSHRLEEEHIERADGYVASSAESMLIAVDGLNGKAASLPVTDFPVTRYASVCERCPYRSLCWEMVQ